MDEDSGYNDFEDDYGNRDPDLLMSLVKEFDPKSVKISSLLRFARAEEVRVFMTAGEVQVKQGRRVVRMWKCTLHWLASTAQGEFHPVTELASV
ncbi:hypothetical protein KIPB_013691, partial [Kipferlia bialata]|eukprot:g13691.t1